jgi:hypothetical protein
VRLEGFPAAFPRRTRVIYTRREPLRGLADPRLIKEYAWPSAVGPGVSAGDGAKQTTRYGIWRGDHPISTNNLMRQPLPPRETPDFQTSGDNNVG